MMEKKVTVQKGNINTGQTIDTEKNKAGVIAKSVNTLGLNHPVWNCERAGTITKSQPRASEQD